MEIRLADVMANGVIFLPPVDFFGTITLEWNGSNGVDYATTPATVTITYLGGHEG